MMMVINMREQLFNTYKSFVGGEPVLKKYQARPKFRRFSTPKYSDASFAKSGYLSPVRSTYRARRRTLLMRPWPWRIPTKRIYQDLLPA